ncbi:MAG: NAD(P)-dependent oxidoreductase, partial [Tissierellaceae bacterium]
MDIVVLDGYTLNPGDISWDGLASLGNLKVYDRTAYDISGANLIVERAKDADVVFTNKTPITREILARLPKLKFIGVLATGYNVVDLEAARERGIPVSNIPAYGTDAVAQMTIALLLEMCNHVGIHSESVFKGQWTNNEDFCYWNKSLIELAGKTMGIVGFGQIGQATANIALALGMDILVNSRSKMKELEGERVRFVDLETLFKDSDVISLHCPLTETNKGMINKGSISKMRDGVM